MKQDLKKFEQTAFRALSAGEKILLKYFKNNKPTDYGYKAHREIVTKADTAANEAIIKILTRETPEFDILSEEGSPRKKSAWRWIVDPLDGTTNFTAHLPLWGISIALEHQGVVVLGLISHPSLKTRYLTRKNCGAWLVKGDQKLRKIRVSVVNHANEALGLLCFGYRRNEKIRALKIEPAFAYKSRAIRYLGAAVVEAAWVAMGRADYSILVGVRPWDVAAGALLVREAGGKVLTPKGREWKINDPDIVFVNQKLKDAVLKISKRI